MFGFRKNLLRLVAQRQRLVLKREKIDDKNNETQAKLENQIAKLRNKQSHLEKSCTDEMKRIDLQLDKIKKQIVLEKAFMSGIDND